MINKKLAIKIGVCVAAIAIPAAIIGGYFGMSKANPYYKYYRTPITSDNNGFVSAYLSSIALGAKILVLPGFTHKEPLVELYKQHWDEVSSTGALLLDESMSMDNSGYLNTWSITFRADLGSFRTGIATCMFLNENVDFFKTSDDDKLTLGMYGGLPFSSVTSFMGGMQQGVYWFNDNLAGQANPYVEGKTLQPIEIVSPNGLTNNFAGGFGVSEGDALIQQYLSLPDLDAFMPVAGPQTWSAQRKIQELNKKTILIGVDSALENDPQNNTFPFKNNGKQIGNGKYIQFSSEKNLGEAIRRVLNIINNGNVLPDGVDENQYDQLVGTLEGDSIQYGGFATVAVGNTTNNLVGVSNDGQSYLNKAIEMSGGVDPSSDESLNTDAKMQYDFNGQIFAYGPSDPFGLQQEFKFLYDAENQNQVLNLEGFVQEGDQSNSNKLMIILSTPNSILFDGSFSESCYIGVYEWYKSMGINIPSRKAAK